jgi:hypothetical protein
MARDVFSSKTIQNTSEAHKVYCSFSTRVLSKWLGGWGMKLTAHFELVPRLRTNGAILLLPLYAFMT